MFVLKCTLIYVVIGAFILLCSLINIKIKNGRIMPEDPFSFMILSIFWPYYLYMLANIQYKVYLRWLHKKARK